MTKILDQSHEGEIADGVLDTVHDLGFDPEESIPGLVRAIVTLSQLTDSPDQVLNEAVCLMDEEAA